MAPAELERAKARGQDSQGRLETLRAEEAQSQEELMRTLQQRRRRRNSAPCLQDNGNMLDALSCLPSETRNMLDKAKQHLANTRLDPTQCMSSSSTGNTQ